MKLRISRLLAIAGFAMVAAAPDWSRAASLTPLVNFNGTNGSFPLAALIADANGDLLGTTYLGGAYGSGTVFEIAKTATGYASTPTTLVSFNGTNGAEVLARLTADANGNLFGTTNIGGAYGLGTVFEIAKTTGGYASTPTTLVSFNGTNGAYPIAGPLIDAKGNLFGTTHEGGANNDGTVFEIVKTVGGYISTPSVLYNFCSLTNCADGAWPYQGLIADADGNLLGTTTGGGAYGLGTVFEIAKTATGYASTPTTLVSFNGTNGESPFGGLITDADGNLFGMTTGGGANNDGTVFEIAKTTGGYASTPTTLVSLNGTNGAGLIVDAKGNLFGTTTGGGANNDGTVFEIAKTASGYASTPITLVSFNGTNGAEPIAAPLTADANGNLFGTTFLGGASGLGTVFQITDSGFVIPVTFAGTPGKPNCHGQSVSALARQYGGLNGATAALGYADVSALQSAILTFCEG